MSELSGGAASDLLEAPDGVDHEDEGTRQRVLKLIVELGPIAAVDLAERLELTSAAVRRHLGALEAERKIMIRTEPAGTKRGRGRPAKRYVASVGAHGSLGTEYADVALAALAQLREALGEEAIVDFARGRSEQLRARYQPVVEAAGEDLTARATALAEALAHDGYAATARPLGAGFAVQMCQGHCPVLQVATAHPELCEEETRVFSDLLGVHVQRLATLAGGEHVCTTHIPVMIPLRKDSE